MAKEQIEIDWSATLAFRFKCDHETGFMLFMEIADAGFDLYQEQTPDFWTALSLVAGACIARMADRQMERWRIQDAGGEG
jgi:hypothetical protein